MYIYIYIYIYINRPTHSVWWSLFVRRLFVGLVNGFELTKTRSRRSNECMDSYR